VVVLDKRITTKGYGRLFIDALPPIERSNNLGDVRRWLDREPIVREPEPYDPSEVASHFSALQQPRSLLDM